MSGLAVSLEAFHFLRPLWLLALPVILLLWVRIRRRVKARAVPQDGLAPHLRAAMTVGAGAKRRLQPIDGVALALVFASIGAAGPTWSRVVDPFATQIAPVVVLLKVAGSMDATDLQPSRLARAKQKIRDLANRRAGGRIALVAYAGSAHRVVPLTEDPQVLLPFLEGLSSEIMPEPGNAAGAALEIARDILAPLETPGGILFVLDSLDPADAAPVNAAISEGVSLAVLYVLPEGVNDRGVESLAGAAVARLSIDDSDLRQVDRALNAAFQRALQDDETRPWHDRAWWLVWPALLLTLLWFRRGWTMQWSMVLAFSMLCSAPLPARSQGLMDWFLTPDQQAMRAYRAKDFDRAAALFEDPLWRGYAQFRDGQYAEAAETLLRVETVQADSLRAIALIRNRAYRDGVRAFETALERDPTDSEIAANLDVARRIVAYVEEAQANSDTGEEAGIGADDVVFDNESGRGAEMQIEAGEEKGPEILTTEQWMNTVETETGNFLRQRFLFEASRSR